MLNFITAKNLENQAIGTMLGPTAFLNEKGGFVDDEMIYRLSEDEYLIIGNAANREKGYKWMRNNAVRMSYNLKIVDKLLKQLC